MTLVAVVLVAGCGGSGKPHAAGPSAPADPGTAPATSAPTAGSTAGSSEAIRAGRTAPRTTADVSFVGDLLTHHRQGVELARLAGTKSGREDVRALARQIERDQRDQLASAEALLRAWHQRPPGKAATDDELPGLAPEDDVRDLGASSGATFDTTFLTMMLEHQLGGVTMADVELEDGRNPGGLELARQVKQSHDARATGLRALMGSS